MFLHWRRVLALSKQMSIFNGSAVSWYQTLSRDTFLDDCYKIPSDSTYKLALSTRTKRLKKICTEFRNQLQDYEKCSVRTTNDIIGLLWEDVFEWNVSFKTPTLFLPQFSCACGDWQESTRVILDEAINRWLPRAKRLSM